MLFRATNSIGNLEDKLVYCMRLSHFDPRTNQLSYNSQRSDNCVTFFEKAWQPVGVGDPNIFCYHKKMEEVNYLWWNSKSKLHKKEKPEVATLSPSSLVGRSSSINITKSTCKFCRMATSNLQICKTLYTIMKTIWSTENPWSKQKSHARKLQSRSNALLYTKHSQNQNSITSWVEKLVEGLTTSPNVIPRRPIKNWIGQLPISQSTTTNPAICKTTASLHCKLTQATTDTCQRPYRRVMRHMELQRTFLVVRWNHKIEIHLAPIFLATARCAFVLITNAGSRFIESSLKHLHIWHLIRPLSNDTIVCNASSGNVLIDSIVPLLFKISNKTQITWYSKLWRVWAQMSALETIFAAPPLRLFAYDKELLHKQTAL